MAGNTLNLSWPSLAGRTYRVEYKEDLGGLSWNPLSPELTGTGAIMSVSLDMSGVPHRFFRLVILP